MDKKEQIIESAVELFAEKGFEGTSIRDLAAKADVNVAMINYYFGSKDKLFEAILECKAAYLKGVLTEIIKDKSLSEFGKIEAFIDSYINRIFSNRLFHRVIHQELMMKQRESLQHSIVTMLSPNALLMKSLIDSGIRKGVFKKVDSALVLASMMGTVNQVLLSRSMCNTLLEKDAEYVPYDDPKFKKRLIDYLKEMMKVLLVK